ncbi:MAG: ferrous iron transport protein B [Ruminococcaceae bacterium]|nr:ferrous iron transport protein B [Oscillospiraceae bacterium]
MSIKIALVGNPNCGKTTLFNALTGSNQYVGNWPGVTVEKKEGRIKRHDDAILTDLPGIYSLSPYTPEEVVARDYLTVERPDAILNIVDGTNLERNLYLTSQLSDLGIPMVIAINMMDIVTKNGDKIDTERLSRELGYPVVEISALKSDGILDAAELAISAAGGPLPGTRHDFSGSIEHILAHIEEAAVHHMPEEVQRWYSIKIFERDPRILDELKLDESVIAHIETDIKKAEMRFDDDAEAIIINERYKYITDITSRCYKRKNEGRLSISERIDRVVTNRWAALPIFAGVMFLVYFLSIGSIGGFTVTFMNEGLFGSFAETYPETFMESWVSIPELFDKLLLDSMGTPIIAPWLYSLIMDGILGGVGAVLGFVPQMLILFMLLSILEDCGYMSRVAFIMDKVFRHFGLSGKSFIPMLVATGCGVPGIMASRTIEQERDRRMTVMTTGFIPCGAKMPLVAMIAGALFGNSPLIATSAYFIGISAVVISGIILKKTKPFAGDPAPFVMELPAYHAPLASNIARTTWDRGWSFIKRAGTVIFTASVIIWVLNSISFDGGIHYITELRPGGSVLEILGSVVAWLFKPLGFGNWQSAVATILGLLAKEEIVGVFGTLSEQLASSGAVSGAADTFSIIGTEFFGGSKLSGFSFLVFNLLCAPCFGAMGAIKREMNNGWWCAFTLIYMTVFAYATSFCIYQLGSLLSGPLHWWEPITGAVSLAIIGFTVYLMIRKNPHTATLKKAESAK